MWPAARRRTNRRHSDRKRCACLFVAAAVCGNGCLRRRDSTRDIDADGSVEQPGAASQRDPLRRRPAARRGPGRNALPRARRRVGAACRAGPDDRLHARAVHCRQQAVGRDLRRGLDRAGPRGAGVAASRRAIVAVAAGAGLAAVWMLLRVLANQETAAAAWAIAAGAFALTVATTGSAIAAGATSSLRAAVIGACLGWGSGVLALLGASALLAQLGLALGTASAAVALAQLLRGREAPLGWTLVMPSAMAAALIGALAAATAELRWYCLIPLPFAPLASRLVPAGALQRPWHWPLRPAWLRCCRWLSPWASPGGPPPCRPADPNLPSPSHLAIGDFR